MILFVAYLPCVCVLDCVILAVFVLTLCLSEQADELKYFWMCASFILQGRINATSPKLTQLSTSSSDIYQIKYFRCSVTARDFPQTLYFCFYPMCICVSIPHPIIFRYYALKSDLTCIKSAALTLSSLSASLMLMHSWSRWEPMTVHTVHTHTAHCRQ